MAALKHWFVDPDKMVLSITPAGGGEPILLKGHLEPVDAPAQEANATTILFDAPVELGPGTYVFQVMDVSVPSAQPGAKTSAPDVPDTLVQAYQMSNEDLRAMWEKLRVTQPEQYDYLVSLVRAFRDGGADYIIVDDRRMKHRIEAAAVACELGLLVEEEVGSDEQQYTAYHYRLTPVGVAIILHSTAPNEYALPG